MGNATIAVANAFVVAQSDRRGWYTPHVFKSKDQFQAWMQVNHARDIMPASCARGRAFPAIDHRREIYTDIDQDEHDQYLAHLEEEYENLNQEALEMTTTQQQPTPIAKPQSATTPRPPIPASVPPSVSPALAAVEALKREVIEARGEVREISNSLAGARTEIKSLHIIVSALREELSNHVMQSQDGYAKLVAAMQPAAVASTASSGDTGAHFCTIHQCEMSKHGKDGQTWYSHKVGEEWCRGGKNGKH